MPGPKLLVSFSKLRKSAFPFAEVRTGQHKIPYFVRLSKIRSTGQRFALPRPAISSPGRPPGGGFHPPGGWGGTARPCPASRRRSPCWTQSDSWVHLSDFLRLWRAGFAGCWTGWRFFEWVIGLICGVQVGVCRAWGSESVAQDVANDRDLSSGAEVAEVGAGAAAAGVE